MSDSTARLHQLSTPDLEGLLNAADEAKFVAHMAEEPSLVRLKGERERLERENLRIAKETLDLEPTFSSSRQQLIDSCQTYTIAKGKYEMGLDSLRSILSGVNPEDVQQQLRKQSEQKEDHSEEVTDKFLSGNLAIQDFLKEFMKERAEAHIYRVKSEQMTKLIRQDQPSRPRTAGFSPNPPTFPSSSYLPSQPPVPQPRTQFAAPQW